MSPHNTSLQTLQGELSQDLFGVHQGHARSGALPAQLPVATSRTAQQAGDFLYVNAFAVSPLYFYS